MGYRLTKDLETGNKMIDDEHRELFRIVNQLLDACNKGKAMSQLEPVIRFLLEHADSHFKHEEQLQENNKYPAIREHKAAHEAYKPELRETLLQIPPTGPTITDIVNLNGQIAALIEHVKFNDKKMCEYLRKKNLSGR